MNETVAQGFFLHFDDTNDTVHIGAAVITRDDYLAVAGLVGVMPAPVGKKLVSAASAAGVTVTVVRCNGPHKVIALTWGTMDVAGMWDVIAMGIAESATKALINALQEASTFEVNALFGDLADNTD